MLLLGIDLETTGVDPSKDLIIEVGAVLYDWDRKMPVRLFSELIDPAPGIAEGFILDPEVIEVTGIEPEILERFGRVEDDVLHQLTGLYDEADFFVGHNCNEFDCHFMVNAHKRIEHTTDKTWLDTIIDIKYPKRIKTRNLRHLAAEHGLLNPFSHRAVFDVLTMFSIMSLYDLDSIIARSKEPMVYLQAIVSYDDKDLAKARGFLWHPGNKVWWKGFKESDAILEAAECGFPTRSIPKPPPER